VQIYASFIDIPLDGSFSLFVPGSDPQNTISVPLSPVPRAGGVSYLVQYPANFSSDATLNYWQGGLVPPVDAHVILQVQIPSNTDSPGAASETIAEATGQVY
jgi:hypothetical protein